MNQQRSSRRFMWITFNSMVISALVSAYPARGQQRTGFAPAMAEDAYGNARKPYRQRRPLDVFQNDAQRNALLFTKYQAKGAKGRSGLIPFALPADLFAKSGFNRAHQMRTTPLLAPRVQQSVGEYGSLSYQARLPGSPDIRTTIARPYTLLRATTMTAPVTRALSFQRAWAPPAPVDSEVEKRTLNLPVAAPPLPSLGQKLRTQTEGMVNRSRDRAWALFAEGDFRQAALQFQAAYMLEPGDVGSRIGELFCCLSLGSPRVSLALFRELVQRNANPFLADLNMATRFGSKRDAQAIRMQIESFAGPRSEIDAAALQCVVYWYMGDRDQAVAATTALVGKHPGSAYADWPDRMRAAPVPAGQNGGTLR